MTKEEAIERLKTDIYKYADFTENPNENEFWMAFDVAIKALEQQTCEDAVSRTAVEKITWEEPSYTDALNVLTEVREKIRQLPSVNPQPKTGWIPVSERLPEDSELVLFSTKTDRVFEGRFFADNTDHQWYAFRDETFAWNNVVIAWMPLPEPYEPQESEDKG